MPILGLTSTETVSAQRWTNIRRRVFYQYPNGSAPLVGLLSMMKEEETNDPEFGWWEKRLKEQSSTAAYISTTVVMAKTVTVTAGTTNDRTISVFTAATQDLQITAGTNYGVCVAADTLFRVGHVIKIGHLLMASGAYEDVKGVIIAIDRTNHYLAFTAMNTTVSTINYDDTANLAAEVIVIGSSFAQGVTDQSTEVYYLPIYLSNFTQIFRTPFSFTGSALVTPVKFDDTGIYKDKAKSHSIDHMIEMEMAFIFGTKWRNATNAANATTPDPTQQWTTNGLPQYSTGGILWFLQQWEAGGSGSSAAGTVASAGAGTAVYDGTAASTASDAAHDADDRSRIIRNGTGAMSQSKWDTYMERLFRQSNNLSNEKLCLCGSGFLKTMNQMWQQQATLVYNPPAGDTFGMEIVAYKSPFGTIYFKTHPLFSRNSTLRYNALFVDVHNMRYRPMSKRDTQLLKNRQPNDADYRKDEWFSEAGLELRMPESFMYMQNVQSYIP
jgi:hypothetical protein